MPSRLPVGVGDLDFGDLEAAPRLGGRIFERTRAGEESEWGRITAWQPPDAFTYRWHISTPPEEATEVEVRFTGQDDDRR